MNAKSNFLKRRELTKWWVAVSHDDRFAEVITHARAMMLETVPERVAVAGAEEFIKILENMTEGPENNVPFPSPGIIHNIDTNGPRPNPEPKKAKK